MGGAGWAARAACVEGRPLGDGAWHTVWAERHGHNLVVGVDDGDAGNGNASIHPAFLALPDGDEGGGALPPPPAPLLVDKHDGVTVGGIPEFVGVNLVTVHDDLSDSKCHVREFNTFLCCLSYMNMYKYVYMYK